MSPEARESEALHLAEQKVRALSIKRAKQPADVLAQALQDARNGQIADAAPNAIGNAKDRTEVAEAIDRLSLTEVDDLFQRFRRNGQPLPTSQPNPDLPLIEKRDRGHLIYYSRMLIAAFDEASTFDRRLHHNQREPALWVDDDKYMQALHDLTVELRRLNTLLENAPERATQTTKAASAFAKNFDSFLESYCSALGKGAASLTIATTIALLYGAGVGKDLIDSLLKHFTALK
jgi:hypothetical protein